MAVVKRVTLTDSWVFNGTIYEPGEVALPDEAYAALGAKGAFPLPAKAAKGKAGDDGDPAPDAGSIGEQPSASE